MSLPIAANTTCDIYRFGTSPPSAPSIAGVPCSLRSDWRGGQEAGDRQISTAVWTHIMLVDAGVDLRDAYTGQMNMQQQDTVCIPDMTATQYGVVFIEHVQAGGPNEHKRVYLDRKQPNWPSNDL